MLPAYETLPALGAEVASRLTATGEAVSRVASMALEPLVGTDDGDASGEPATADAFLSAEAGSSPATALWRRLRHGLITGQVSSPDGQ